MDKPSLGPDTSPAAEAAAAKAGMAEAEMAKAATARAVPSLPRLFFSFLKLGISAFGGPAAIAHIRTMAVEKKKWIDKESFREGMALCQTIPGATGMQVCAYVGLKLRGVPGALACYLGFILPAFLLMLGLSALYASFDAVPLVAALFGSLRALIVALMAYGAWSFGKSYLKRWQDFSIAAAAAALFWFGLGPVWVIAISAALGLILKRTSPQAQKSAAPGSRPSVPAALWIVIGAALVFLIIFFLVDRKLLDLSLLMMKVDFFAYGGGFGSVPLMLHEVVDLRHWMSPHTFMDGIALGQVTPGPIVITSTFVGYLLQGPWGAIVASASIFFPSFVLVILISPFFAKLNALRLFRSAIDGVLCSFVGLMLSVALRMGFAVSWDLPRALVAGAAFAALMLRVDVLWVILGGVGLSLFIR